MIAPSPPWAGCPQGGVGQPPTEGTFSNAANLFTTLADPPLPLSRGDFWDSFSVWVSGGLRVGRSGWGSPNPPYGWWGLIGRDRLSKPLRLTQRYRSHSHPASPKIRFTVCQPNPPLLPKISAPTQTASPLRPS